jgi:hypothetical protein
MAQGVYLIASFLQGSWVLDVDGQPIATDFVNIWSGGHQILLGEDPAAIYDVQLHKNAEAAALGHEFPGEYPWLYPPTFLLLAGSLALCCIMCCFRRASVGRVFSCSADRLASGSG